MAIKWKFLTSMFLMTKAIVLILIMHSWLDQNPWEFPRHDVVVDIQFYGYVRKFQDDDGKSNAVWEGGEIVKAVAYDVPVPGYDTPSTNNLRLWSSKAASGEFDFQKFNSGDYERCVDDLLGKYYVLTCKALSQINNEPRLSLQFSTPMITSTEARSFD
jgi:hypothetical protein